MRKVHYELICGGREFNDEALMVSTVKALIAHVTKGDRELEVVAGGARGADRLGASVARSLGITVIEIAAEWDRFGKSAGYRRNQQMADLLVGRREEGHTVGVTAFPGGAGTGHMVRIARTENLRVVFP